MTYILKNKNLELKVDLPNENYQLSRFDWTGKITELKYKNRYLTTHELLKNDNGTYCGQGFYNEFGIDTPLAYKETKVGDWFHKIGVGLLRKEEKQYAFDKKYEIKPAEFETLVEDRKILFKCRSENYNGYSYILEKKIKLLESGFQINYHLENTGEKTISTNEYNHNFISIDRTLIGRDYRLKFPFKIMPDQFGEYVDPEQIVDIGIQDIKFKKNPQEQFFFSNLSGGEMVDAKWILENIKSKIGISETGNFQTNSVNLWGWGHVISPELFINLIVEAGQFKKWSRNYAVYEVD